MGATGYGEWMSIERRYGWVRRILRVERAVGC